MFLRRRRALRDLDAFGANFEEWLRTRNETLRTELLGAFPKTKQLYARVGASGFWCFERTIEDRNGRYIQEARDSLTRARGAYRDGVDARAETSGDEKVPLGRWGETVQNHPVIVALGFILAGFIAGFATREALDRWVPWRAERPPYTAPAPESAMRPAP